MTTDACTTALRELLTDDDAINNAVDYICTTLSCDSDEIHSIEAMKVGLTNISFKFYVGDDPYVFRYPGAQTDLFLSRRCEKQAEEVAHELGIDRSFIALDPDTGFKISHFIEDCVYIDPFDVDGDQKKALSMLRAFHNTKTQSDWVLDFFTKADVYFDIMREQNSYDFSEHLPLRSKIERLSNLLEQEGYERTLCHSDTWYWNFLKDPQDQYYLIDWEYAGMNYPQADVANYVISLDVTEEQYLDLAEHYEGHELSLKEKRFYFGMLSMCTWYWFVWALYTETRGTKVDDLPEWYRKTVHYLKRAMELFGEE